jgi:hypothetical protein
LRQRPTGGARPSGLSPTFDRRVSRAPFKASAVIGRLPRAPHLQTPQSSRNEALPSFPLFNRRLPSLISPP